MTKPITTKETCIVYRGVQYEYAVKLINEAITTRDWHQTIVDDPDWIKDYNAIILHPYSKFNDKLLSVVKSDFKEAGWDCRYKLDCYDARGPHMCFYVHKKHFNED